MTVPSSRRLGTRGGRSAAAMLLASSSAITASLLFGVPAPQAADLLPELARFQFERQAQNHCPGEDIVWVDPGSRIYDASAARFYGRTKSGAFVCLRDAESAGYHARNKS